jgi:anti-anti-sigma factor
MKIHLKRSEPSGIVLLEVAGSINSDDFVSYQQNPLDEVVGADWRGKRLLMDLSRAEVVGSPGIGWLVATHSACAKGGGKLVLHSLASFIKGELELLGLVRLLHIVASEAEARAKAQDK